MQEKNLETQIKEILEEIRPYLNQEGGDIEFIRLEDNYVFIKLTGACQQCFFQDDTINYGIEALIKNKIPEINGVINVDL